MPSRQAAGPPRFSVIQVMSSLPGRMTLAEWPSGLGKGLQSPVHGFDSRLRLEGG
jgi:hypothetical protein